MLMTMTGLRHRLRTPLRATLVALVVIVLVPAWVARTALVFACPSMHEARKVPCCPVAAKEADADRDPSPAFRKACCASDEIDLGTTRPPSAHEDALAIVPPVTAVVIAALDADPRAPRALDHAPPRATGPPTYLRKLALLL